MSGDRSPRRSGSAAGCPNESGQYSTGGDSARSGASARRPASRLRTSASPLGISSSARTYHGPASSRPSRSSCAELGGALGADVEIVVEDDRLPVEQKASRRRRRIVEQLVDQRDESLPKALERMVPLAIPVRV